MQGGIDALTMPALSLALDAAVMRHQAIASNIANAHTVGYVPQRLSFEAEVTRAWQSRAETPGSLLQPPTTMALRVRTEASAAVGAESGAVHLDREVAALAQNSTHYQMLLRGLNRHLTLLTSAVSEGKR